MRTTTKFMRAISSLTYFSMLYRRECLLGLLLSLIILSRTHINSYSRSKPLWVPVAFSEIWMYIFLGLVVTFNSQLLLSLDYMVNILGCLFLGRAVSHDLCMAFFHFILASNKVHKKVWLKKNIWIFTRLEVYFIIFLNFSWLSAMLLNLIKLI